MSHIEKQWTRLCPTFGYQVLFKFQTVITLQHFKYKQSPLAPQDFLFSGPSSAIINSATSMYFD